MEAKYKTHFILGVVLLLLSSAFFPGADLWANESSKYLDAVREFADNVLKYGRDTYGPKHTPLFVDGLNIHTHEPVKWISPKGNVLTATETEEWILSNFASQQTLLRTLDGLSEVTGAPKYRDAAVQAIKYAFENLRAPNGLFYWGENTAYDAQADKIVVTYLGHTLKLVYPYYELMWQVDPEATKRFIEAFWSAQILDWSNLDFNRYAPYPDPLEEPWSHEYKGGPVFFKSKRPDGKGFFSTGTSLTHAAALLSQLSGQEQPLIWGKRLMQRYIDTRNPKVGISAYAFNSLDSGNWTFPVQPYRYRVLDNPEERHVHPWLSLLLTGEMLGEKGCPFTQWVLEEMTAWGKVSYRKKDNSFVPMLIDGTNLEGHVKDAAPKGFNVAESFSAGPQYFWAYSAAYRATGDPFMWEMLRDIAFGNSLGDVGKTPSDAPELRTKTDCSHAYVLLGFLQLHEKTKESEFLEMARCIGDNIVLNKFHKGFFVPSKKHTYVLFDCFEPLVLLHLVRAISSQSESIPTVWPSLAKFFSNYRFRYVGIDCMLFYTLTESNEPPFSLAEAASIGDVSLVKRLLESGVDADRVEHNRCYTALQRAAISGHKDIAELLVVCGAQVNTGPSTPLHYAVEYGHKDVVALLISKGADVNVKNNAGQTPLDIALSQGNKEIIKLLLDKGAKITSLHQAVQFGDLAIVKALFKQGADVNAKDKQGKTVLFYAVEHNYKDIVELLIAKGADVNAKEDGGYTPLYYALWYENKDLTTLLISKGAEVNVEPEKDYPLIYYAVWNEDLDTVKLLVAKGAKFDVKILEDRTAFHYAVGQGSRDIAEFFVSKGIDDSTFHVAAGMGDLARVRSHIEQGVDVNTQDELGWTPLYWAASLGRTEVAKLLINKGADIRIAATDGGTALHQAAQAGDNELVELMLSKGADVQAKTKRGITPLHGAAGSGHREVAESLIAKGAEIDAKDRGGRTPLYRAVLSGHTALVELLLAKGADANVKDGRGRTLLSWAKQRGHTEIVELLRKHDAKE